MAAQLPEVIRLVGIPRPTFDHHAEGVRQTLKNLGPVLLALGVVQISSLIDLQIASYLQTGAVTNLYNANLIVLLPVSLFGVSVAAASLPEFSRDSDARKDALLDRLRGGWQRILFFVVPCAVVFIAYGDLCVGLLYRGGVFGASQQFAVSIVLSAYAVGLVSFASVKLLASAHYALQDYRTPLRASVSSLAVSAVAAAALAYPFRESPWGAAGIALGSALGSFVNMAVQARGLRRRLGTLYTSAMWRGTLRIVVASILAALVALPVRWLLRDRMPVWSAPPTLVVFGIVYLIAAWLMGSREAARWLRLSPRGAA